MRAARHRASRPITETREPPDVAPIPRGEPDVHPPADAPAYRATALRHPDAAARHHPADADRTDRPGLRARRRRRRSTTTSRASTPASRSGQRIVIEGRVLDEGGRPVPHTLIEVWQANAAGRYAHKVDQWDAPLDANFTGAGRTLTDAEGRYRFVTIRPGAYPWRNHHNAWRPAHIHFSLFGHGVPHAPGHADVLPGRSAAGARSDLQRRARGAGARAHGRGLRPRRSPSRRSRSATGSTSCCAVATRRRWRRADVAGLTPFQTVGPYLHLGLRVGLAPMTAPGRTTPVVIAGPAARRRRRRHRRRRARVLGRWDSTASGACGPRPTAATGSTTREAGDARRRRRRRPRAALRRAGARPRHPHRVPDARVLRRRARQRARRRARRPCRPTAAPRSSPWPPRQPSIISTSSCRASARRCSSTSERGPGRAVLPMTAPVHAAVHPARRVQAMLDVEVALAEALAETGVIPVASVAPIRAAARAERFDLAALTAEADERRQPAHPAGAAPDPRRRGRSTPAAAGHVHWGATSQDVIDTALVLQLRDAVGRRAGGARTRPPTPRQVWPRVTSPRRLPAAPGCSRPRRPPSAPRRRCGSTGWTGPAQRLAAALDDALDRAVRRRHRHAVRAWVRRTGGGRRAGRASRPARARHRRGTPSAAASSTSACALGLACGTLGKIGRDVIAAGADRGRRSRRGGGARARRIVVDAAQAQPGARRCVAAAAAVQAPGLVATMLAAMPQEHERAAGAWQAEWDTLPALVDARRATPRTAMADALAHLVVDEARMRANLDAAGGVARAEGLVAALAPALGRRQALRARRGGVPRRHRATAARSPTSPPTTADCARILDAGRHRRGAGSARRSPGPSRAFVDRVLARWQRDGKE